MSRQSCCLSEGVGVEVLSPDILCQIPTLACTENTRIMFHPLISGTDVPGTAVVVHGSFCCAGVRTTTRTAARGWHACTNSVYTFLSFFLVQQSFVTAERAGMLASLYCTMESLYGHQVRWTSRPVAGKKDAVRIAYRARINNSSVLLYQVPHTTT